MIPTLIGAAVLVFVLMRLIPGDICVLRLASGGGSIDPTVLRNCRAEIGTDQPCHLAILDVREGVGGPRFRQVDVDGATDHR